MKRTPQLNNGTEIEVDNQGRITGRFKTKNCLRQEKIKRLLFDNEATRR